MIIERRKTIKKGNGFTLLFSIAIVFTIALTKFDGTRLVGILLTSILIITNLIFYVKLKSDDIELFKIETNGNILNISIYNQKTVSIERKNIRNLELKSHLIFDKVIRLVTVEGKEMALCIPFLYLNQEYRFLLNRYFSEFKERYNWPVTIK